MEAARRPLADSPWLWAYLFGAAALIALALITPKYAHRQAQIEREFQGRQRAAQHKAGQEPTVEVSTPDSILISLKPLLWVSAVVTAVAWFVFWRLHVIRHPASTTTPLESPP